MLFAALQPRVGLGQDSVAGLVLELEVPRGFLTAIANAGDGSGRLFLARQGGEIYIYEGSSLRPAPFLHVTTWVFGDEQGLLGLAFHPAYATNGFFYVYYTGSQGETVVSRFSVSESDPNTADPGSELVLLTASHPHPNHRAGQLAFGPDGFLYIGVGDGVDREKAQDLSSLSGKILRIDVDTENGAPYEIPADNPFAHLPSARPEVWALGLRNPWRFSFDRTEGSLFIADVGEGRYEEVNILPPGDPGGENFGWPRMEGPLCFEPPTDCNDGTLTLTLPSFGYGHDIGFAVIGGYRYRGPDFPELDGTFVFADFAGRLFAATINDGVWTFEQQYVPNGSAGGFAAFGEDEAGELYLAEFFRGIVYRVVSTVGPSLRVLDPPAVSESTAEAVFEVTLSEPSDDEVSVGYRSLGSASVVEAREGRVVFSPGQTRAELHFALLDDDVDEPDTNVRLSLFEPIRGRIADFEGILTVEDDDPPPSVSIGDCSIVEGDASFEYCSFQLTLSQPSGWTTAAEHTATDGTATKFSDYTMSDGILTFAPGETTRTIQARIYGDLAVEADETFFVTLSTERANSHLAVGDGIGEGLILNDDDPPPAEVPTLVEPAGASANVAPTFRWSGPATASRYRLVVLAPGPAIVWDSELSAFTSCNGVECSASLPFTIPEWDYEWHVFAGNKVGFGPSSPSLGFRVDLPPHSISTAAGTGTNGFSGENRLGFTANVSSPQAVTVDVDDNVFVAAGRRIRKLDPETRLLVTVAGTGNYACTPDGVTAVDHALPNVLSLAIAGNGDLYFGGAGASDCGQVRRIDHTTGIVTAVAGAGGPFGDTGDGGPATEAALGPPYGLAFDRSGNLFIADTFHHRIRRVDKTKGTISTAAGTGVAGFAGDGDYPTLAQLSSPRGLAFDADDQMFIADTNNGRIRRIGVIGVFGNILQRITTVVGDVPEAEIRAPLREPADIVIDEAGDLWISDVGQNQVYRVDLRNETYEVVAGTGLTTGPLGDGGPPLQARIHEPDGLAIDGEGNLFVATRPDARVRSIDNQRPIAVAGPDQEIVAGDEFTLDGTSSSDPDGDTLRFEWQDPEGRNLSFGPVYRPRLDVGVHDIVLEVSDDTGPSLGTRSAST